MVLAGRVAAWPGAALFLALAACAGEPRADTGGGLPRLRARALYPVTSPGCISRWADGSLACAAEWDTFIPPPDWSRLRSLVLGRIAICGLERAATPGEPMAIGCWQAYDTDDDTAPFDLTPPTGALFTSLARGRHNAMCAAGPGQPPVCWGGDRADDAVPTQPGPTLSHMFDVVGLAESPCGLCALDGAGVVTCDGKGEVKGIDDCEHPLPGGPFTSIVGHDTVVCGIDTAGVLSCAGGESRGYPWNRAIPDGVRWSSFDPGFEGGCGVTIDGKVACFTTGYPYYCYYCEYGDYWDVHLWTQENLHLPWTYSSVVDYGTHLYALRTDGLVELRWDPACDEIDDTGWTDYDCPPDPSLWASLGYREPVNVAPPFDVGLPPLLR